MKQHFTYAQKKKSAAWQVFVRTRNAARNIFNTPAEWQVLFALLLLMGWRLTTIIAYVIKQF